MTLSPTESGPPGAARHASPAGRPDTLDARAARMGRRLARSLSSHAWTRKETLRIVRRALGAHDEDTLAHTLRVEGLGARLGAALGLPEDERDALAWAAALHDVGKLAVPGAVLRERGPLGPGASALLRSHVAVGAAFAGALPAVPPEALPIIAGHHERWDGTGYPLGLRGEEIPLGARILAVADVYDALVSARSYKPAWSRAAALAEIRAQAGRHFDPAVVEALALLEGAARLPT